MAKLTTKSSVLGLITARGGSKGLPGKNVALLAGKPLVKWSIDAATGSGCVDRVVVSTDDEEIASVCRTSGAEVPFLRPADLARDESPHVLAVLHALDWLENRDRYVPAAVLLLQPTSPLRTADDVRASVALLAPNVASVVGVVEADKHPFKSFVTGGDGRLRRLWPEADRRERRQDLPCVYCENGAIYLNRTEQLRVGGKLAPEGAVPYLMPRERSIDIDSEWDLRLAEWIVGGTLTHAGGRSK